MLLFFAGLILSVPLSLGVNILTPSVQNRLARRDALRAARRTESLKRELANARQYKTASDKLHRAMLAQVLRISLVTSVGTALVTASFATFYLDDLFNFLGFLVGTVTSLIVIPLCLNVLRLNFRVEHFEEYSRGVLSLIDNLDSSSPDSPPDQTQRA